MLRNGDTNGSINSLFNSNQSDSVFLLSNFFFFFKYIYNSISMKSCAYFPPLAKVLMAFMISHVRLSYPAMFKLETNDHARLSSAIG